MKNYPWTKSVQKYALVVLASQGMVPAINHLSLAYITWIETMQAYDDTKCANPLTYFGYRLRAAIQNERNYSDGVVHVPVGKKDSYEVVVSDIDAPIGGDGDGLTLGDILPCKVEEELALSPDIVASIKSPSVRQGLKIIMEAHRLGYKTNTLISENYANNSSMIASVACAKMWCRRNKKYVMEWVI